MPVEAGRLTAHEAKRRLREYLMTVLLKILTVREARTPPEASGG